jgi:hypothetical protein
MERPYPMEKVKLQHKRTRPKIRGKYDVKNYLRYLQVIGIYLNAYSSQPG